MKEIENQKKRYILYIYCAEELVRDICRDKEREKLLKLHDKAKSLNDVTSGSCVLKEWCSEEKFKSIVIDVWCSIYCIFFDCVGNGA